MKYTLCLAAILCATIAHADVSWTIDRGDGVHIPNPACDHSCNPNVPTPAPLPHDKSDPVAAAVEQHWTGICGSMDGTNQLVTHTAAGRDPTTAKRQCAARIKALRKAGKPIPVYSDVMSILGGFVKVGERK